LVQAVILLRFISMPDLTTGIYPL